MTDESDDTEDENIIVERKLLWRSDSNFVSYCLICATFYRTQQIY